MLSIDILVFALFVWIFAVVVEFEAVDGVLPDDVAAGAYGGERIDVGTRHPDGKCCVFLS